MSDLIKRSDAIKTIDDKVNGSDNRLYLKDLVNAIPSADRPRGEWIINADRSIYKYHCTNCEINCKVDYDYCPWCGARMKGADDE